MSALTQLDAIEHAFLLGQFLLSFPSGNTVEQTHLCLSEIHITTVDHNLDALFKFGS